MADPQMTIQPARLAHPVLPAPLALQAPPAQPAQLAPLAQLAQPAQPAQLAQPAQPAQPLAQGEFKVTTLLLVIIKSLS